MYSQERAPENAQPRMASGVHGRGDAQFVSGRWYVKLSANEVSDIVQRVCTAWLPPSTARWNSPMSFPRDFALLPQTGRDPSLGTIHRRDFSGTAS